MAGVEVLVRCSMYGMFNCCRLPARQLDEDIERSSKYIRDDLLPNKQAHDSLASLHNFTSQVATKDGGIVRSKNVLILHDPVDRINSYAMDFDRHMTRRRSTIWRRRNDEWPTFGFQRPGRGVGRRGG